MIEWLKVYWYLPVAPLLLLAGWAGWRWVKRLAAPGAGLPSLESKEAKAERKRIKAWKREQIRIVNQRFDALRDDINKKFGG